MKTKLLFALFMCCATSLQIQAQCRATIAYQLNPNSTVDSLWAANITGGGFFTNYTWSFGDGTSGSGAQVAHPFPYNGVPLIFYVCLTMSDSSAGCNFTTCDSVHVPGSSTSSCNTAVSYFNRDSLYTFNTSVSGVPPFTFSWTVNGASTGITAGLTTLVIDSLNATLGTEVCVTVTDSTGCVSTSCAYISNANQGHGCNTYIAYTNIDTLYTFTTSNSGVAPFTYSWSLNGQTIGNSATFTRVVNDSTAGSASQVCVAVMDSVGCVSTNCVYVTRTNQTNCSTYAAFTNQDSLYTFTATHIGINPVTYQWFYMNAQVGTSSSATLVLDSASVATGATVCVYVTDANGCVSSDCITVGGNPVFGGPCRAYFIIYPDSANGASGYYSGNNYSTGNYGSNILWSFGDSTTSTDPFPTHTYANPGMYIICLTIGVPGTSCYDTYCDSSFYAFKTAPGPMSHLFIQGGSTTSVKEVSQNTAIRIYPNPVSDDLNITSAENIGLKRIFNLNGQKVFETKTVSNKIDVSKLATGVYILELTSEGKVSRLRFVKQ